LNHLVLIWALFFFLSIGEIAILAILDRHSYPLDWWIKIPSSPTWRNSSSYRIALNIYFLMLITSTTIWNNCFIFLLQKFVEHCVLMFSCNMISKDVFLHLFSAFCTLEKFFSTIFINMHFQITLLDSLSTFLWAQDLKFVNDFLQTHIGLKSKW